MVVWNGGTVVREFIISYRFVQVSESNINLLSFFLLLFHFGKNRQEYKTLGNWSWNLREAHWGEIMPKCISYSVSDKMCEQSKF